MLIRSAKHPQAHPWLFCLILLSASIPTVWAQHERLGNPTPQPEPQNGLSGEAEENGLRWHEGLNDNTSQAALDVQHAITILGQVEKPQSSLSRFDPKSGILGLSVYYAKEAFVLLFMNGPKEEDYVDTEQEEQKLAQPMAKAVTLLEQAAKRNSSDALFLLAEMNFHGNFTHPRNYKEAFKRYNQLADLTGNDTAQYMVGFMYATGIGDSVERNQAKALLYHTFAAQSGNIRSEMTTAFRHHSGIGTARNCNEAAVYYKKVADKAIAYSRSGPPGGLSLQRDTYRLADEKGGAYGEGASVVSSGMNANRAPANSDQHAALDDVLEYLDIMSRKGDLKATFSLGRLHYDGSRTMRPNIKVARQYFRTVAQKYWARDGAVISDDLDGVGRIAAKAAAFLANMYLRGEGTAQSYEKALTWFKRGLRNGDAACQSGLGFMYLHGYGVSKDPVKAAELYKAAAEQDRAVAQVELGKLFLDQGDLGPAIRYFELATRHGHIEAFYYLAEISNYGIGRDRSCNLATAYYKIVAEKAEALHSSFEEANAAYDDGDDETALVGYLMAAEQGYEQAQANVAHMLDSHRSILPLERFLPSLFQSQPVALLQNAALALIHWTRSAKQSNIDSMVKMGDYYLGGWGIEKDVEKAAMCYQTAADHQQSAQAMWNLGWMHENGLGVEQDFHLAKRFYDQALETNQESYLPVKLSLLKLRIRSAWNTVSGGEVKGIQAEDAPTTDPLTWSQWLNKFIASSQESYLHDEDFADDDLSDPLFHGPIHGEDDLDSIDDSVLESLLILAMACALAGLVYYRQQRLQSQRRAAALRQQQQAGAVDPVGNGEGRVGNPPRLPGQQADGGFFPARGQDGFADWAVGGVGH